MGELKNALMGIGTFLVLVILNGCSLSTSNGDPALHLDLSSLRDRSGQSALSHPGNLLQGLTSAPPPASPTGFYCYGVNVTGPGIPDTSLHPEANPQAQFNQTLTVPGNYCSYRGVVTPAIQLTSTGNTEVALQVPPGGVRLVQVVGVNDASVCATGVLGNDSAAGSSSGSRYFEIGRGVVYDLFGDRSIEITTSWPSGSTTADQLDRAKRALDCGGGCANVYDYTAGGTATDLTISGTPYKFAQKIPTVPGRYLRKVRLYLHPTSAAVSATVTLYTSAVDSPPTSATAYASSVTLAASSAAAWIDFDLYNANSGFLQMQAGSDYWAVIGSSDASGSNILNIGHGAGTGNGSVQSSTNAGTSWSASSSTGIYSQVYGCSAP